MALTIIWTEQATKELDYILNYWNDRIGTTDYSIRLVSLFDKTLNTLSSLPKTGKETDNRQIRYRIVKDYFLFYSYDDSALYVVDICDMRRDPTYIRSLLQT